MKKMGPIAHRLSHRREFFVGCSSTTGACVGSTRRSCSRKVQKDSSAPHTMMCPVSSLTLSMSCVQRAGQLAAQAAAAPGRCSRTCNADCTLNSCAPHTMMCPISLLTLSMSCMQSSHPEQQVVQGQSAQHNAVTQHARLPLALRPSCCMCNPYKAAVVQPVGQVQGDRQGHKRPALPQSPGLLRCCCALCAGRQG